MGSNFKDSKSTWPKPKGKARHQDLWEIFHRVNKVYFNGSISVKTVSWGVPDMIHKNGMSCVPAAAIYPNKELILVHEALPYMRAPKYVYTYLIYHECLHLVVPPENGNCHGPEFCMREKFAPNRKRSIEWLAHKNFPVMEG